MRAVAAYAREGGLVLGICNGFQVLAEAGLLPGALLRNRSLRFVCRDVDDPGGAGRHAVHSPRSAGTSRSECRSPTARAASMPTMPTLDALEGTGGVLFRYVGEHGPASSSDRANPNGSLRGIAGVVNPAGNVAGLMPHPERAADGLLGSDDGMLLLRSLVESAAARENGGIDDVHGTDRPLSVTAAGPGR